MHAVIFDTEYLTDDGVMSRHWSGINDVPPLLVQLAAYKVKVDKGLPITDELFLFSKPRDAYGRIIDPSAYFTRLTGINAEQIADNGREFKDVMDEFLSFIGDEGIAYSYGNDFIRPILYTCFYTGYQLPFSAKRGRDVRKIFCAAGMSEAEVSAQSSGSIARYMGIDIDSRYGHIHDARFDALSIIEALRFLEKQGRLQPSALSADW